MWISKKRFEELESKVEKIEQTHCGIVEFLSKHNKDDIVKGYGKGCLNNTEYIVYLHKGELKYCELPFILCSIEPIENKERYAIDEIRSTMAKHIYKLDKQQNVIVNISSEYKKTTED